MAANGFKDYRLEGTGLVESPGFFFPCRHSEFYESYPDNAT